MVRIRPSSPFPFGEERDFFELGDTRRVGGRRVFVLGARAKRAVLHVRCGLRCSVLDVLLILDERILPGADGSPDRDVLIVTVVVMTSPMTSSTNLACSAGQRNPYKIFFT